MMKPIIPPPPSQLPPNLVPQMGNLKTTLGEVYTSRFPSEPPTSSPVSPNKISLLVVSAIKYLGVYIDSRLTYGSKDRKSTEDTNYSYTRQYSNQCGAVQLNSQIYKESKPFNPVYLKRSPKTFSKFQIRPYTKT
jgi:hypothetical protein